MVTLGTTLLVLKNEKLFWKLRKMRTVLVPSKTEKIEMKDENISSKTFFSKSIDNHQRNN